MHKPKEIFHLRCVQQAATQAAADLIVGFFGANSWLFWSGIESWLKKLKFSLEKETRIAEWRANDTKNVRIGCLGQLEIRRNKGTGVHCFKTGPRSLNRLSAKERIISSKCKPKARLILYHLIWLINFVLFKALPLDLQRLQFKYIHSKGICSKIGLFPQNATAVIEHGNKIYSYGSLP